MEKKFELRNDDRDFKVGDELVLQEFVLADVVQPDHAPSSGAYTGREISALVTYILRGESWGLQPNKCIMSIDITKYYRNSG